MKIIDRIQQIAHIIDLFVGAFSYPLVKLVVMTAVILGVSLIFIQRRGRHHPENDRTLGIAITGCIVALVAATTIGIWSYSQSLRSQQWLSSEPSPISWETR